MKVTKCTEVACAEQEESKIGLPAGRRPGQPPSLSPAVGYTHSHGQRKPPPAIPFDSEGSGVIQLDTFSGMRYTMHESRLDCYAQLDNSVYARV